MSTNLRPSIEERELDLALREAELNRRESALRRAEMERTPPPVPERNELDDELIERLAAVERRERELGQTVEAVEAQRQRLEEVRAEYEERRDALTQRARELEAERAKLREEQARLVTKSIELDEVTAALRAEPKPALPPVSPAPQAKAAADAFKDPTPGAPGSPIDDWWAKQLGKPLEAA